MNKKQWKINLCRIRNARIRQFAFPKYHNSIISKRSLFRVFHWNRPLYLLLHFKWSAYCCLCYARSDLPYTYSLTATVTLPPSLCAMQTYRPWSSGRASSMRNVLSSNTLDRPSGKLPLSRCHVTFGFGSPVNCH